MINIDELVKRARLQGLQESIDQWEVAHQFADGEFVPLEGDLIPKALNRDRERAWWRIMKQLQTPGVSIVGTKKAAVLGRISVGGAEPGVTEGAGQVASQTEELAEFLDSVGFDQLLDDALTDMIVWGMAAGMAHRVLGDDGPTDEITISRLTGYLEPIYRSGHRDRVEGIYQAWTSDRTDINRDRNPFRAFSDNDSRRRTGRATAWNVRVYDWSEGEDRAVIREWNGLKQPWEMGRAPDEVIDQAPVPRFRIFRKTVFGIPNGELFAAIPFLQALWATSARLLLSEEMTAFPMLKTSGALVTDRVRIGPSEVLQLSQDGTAEWMSPGDLEELRQQRDLREREVERATAMPVGFFSGQAPSGVAIEHGNTRWVTTNDKYASQLEGLATELAADAAELIETEAAPVNVGTNKLFGMAQRITSIREAYNDGLIPLEVAAREVSVFFPSWEEGERERWIAEQTATISPADFDRLTAGAVADDATGAPEAV